MKNYFTINEDISEEIVIRRSRFICSASPITTQDEGLLFVKDIKKKYSDATHNCYAIVGMPMDFFEKSSDDGEPSGTAGAPIKNMINMLGFKGIVCVVSRYFGGIKLGASGLTSAYAESVENCLNKARIVERVWSDFYSLDVSYSKAEEIQNFLSFHSDISVKAMYKERVTLELGIPPVKNSIVKGFAENVTRGKVKMQYSHSNYISRLVSKDN